MYYLICIVDHSVAALYSLYAAYKHVFLGCVERTILTKCEMEGNAF
jgi:hypothetical protein